MGGLYNRCLHYSLLPCLPVFVPLTPCVAYVPLVRAQKVLIQTACKTSQKKGVKGRGDDDGVNAALHGDVHGVLAHIVRDEGAAGLYKGIQPQLTKGVLSSALLLTGKEKIDWVVRSVLIGAR